MRAAITVIALIVGVFFALVVQEFIAPLGVFHGARVNLVPVLFCYGAMALPFPLMLVLATITGFLVDLSALQIIDGVPEIAVGWSAVFYLLAGMICQGLRPLVLRGHWELHSLMSAITAILFVAMQFAMVTLNRLESGGFFWNEAVTWRILGPGIVALFAAPVFWFALALTAGPPRGRVERALEV